MTKTQLESIIKQKDAIINTLNQDLERAHHGQSELVGTIDKFRKALDDKDIEVNSSRSVNRQYEKEIMGLKKTLDIISGIARDYGDPL